MNREPEPMNTRLLLVEDNPADVELLRYVLDQAGVRCDWTVLVDGEEALALVQQRGRYLNAPVPDLAIVDLNLPRYDGMEILAAMSANRAFAEMPVLVMSSSSSPRDRAKIEVSPRFVVTSPSHPTSTDT